MKGTKMDTEQAIRDYLPDILHMSLATSRDNRPWVCEVHFAYDSNLNLYFRSLLSRRHSQDIQINPNVAGNIVTQHSLNQKVRAVYFEGIASVLNADKDIKMAFECLKARFHLKEEVLSEASSEEGHKIFKVNVKNFYVFDGRDSNPAQKYELPWHGDNI
jgi:uncharacterized protein YhbP (UPF0306 family)